MDPIGLALENYDAIGKWRDTEGGTPIDASGELSQVQGGGSFVGSAELGRKLAASADVEACSTQVWFRYAFGRTQDDADACTLGELARAQKPGAWNSRDLILSLVQTDAFRFRTVTP